MKTDVKDDLDDRCHGARGAKVIIISDRLFNKSRRNSSAQLKQKEKDTVLQWVAVNREVLSDLLCNTIKSVFMVSDKQHQYGI